jgi:DNA-binding transcriptional MerR regulator
MAAPKTLYTITELARQSGLASRTIRFWSDSGLIPVARRSEAQYRLYDHQALARLMLVRTLRELGLGIKPITQILKQQKTLAQAAATHIAAIEARLSELRVQRAVLRVVVRRGADAQETLVMQRLLQASVAERRRIVEEFVGRAFEGIDDKAPGAMVANAMRSLPPELPDEPSDAQGEAWLELLSMLNDQSFAARVREMVTAGAAQTKPPQPVDMAAIRQHAQAALDAGIAASSDAAHAVLERIVPGMPRAERVQLREQLEVFNDVRVERYWELMGVLNNRPPFPKLANAVQWFIAALRARE